MKINKTVKKRVICLQLNFNLLDESFKNNTHRYSTEYLPLNQIIDKLNKSDSLSLSSIFNVYEDTAYNTELKINDITFDNHNLVSGDNIYIVPGTNLPRYKIREKGKEVGFKIKRDLEKANVVIFDKKIFDSLNKWYSSRLFKVDKAAFLEYLDEENVDPSLIFTNTQLDIIDQEDGLYIDYNICMVKDVDSKFSKFRYGTNDYCVLSQNYTKEKEILNKIDKMMSLNITGLNATDVLADLNDSTVMDEKMFNRLRQMLSSDTASCELAMELICNVNIEKSAFYLLRLLNERRDTMRWTSTYNNANFKSFRTSLDTFFQTSRRDEFFYYGIDVNSMISSLGKAKILKKEHIVELMDQIKNAMNSMNPHRIFFDIKNIEATPALKKMLIESKEYLNSRDGE